jgi:hypothetical protein
VPLTIGAAGGKGSATGSAELGAVNVVVTR